jgi:uncharacterized protein (TIGR02145 family)
MKTQLTHVRANSIRPLLAATLGLAITFTLSCSDDKDDGGGQNSFSDPGKGNDIANYKTKQIGTQTWMAENLNYNVSGSKCYGEGGQLIVDDEGGDTPIRTTLSNDEVKANCDKYGRLYDWATAMVLPSSCNSTSCASRISAKHKGICPDGWHIPSNADWDVLVNYAGGYSTAGTKLRTTSGWELTPFSVILVNGTDDYGFSALPGGYGEPDGDFGGANYDGNWWSASEYDSDFAYFRYMFSWEEYVRGNIMQETYFDHDKSDLSSVRCVQD